MRAHTIQRGGGLTRIALNGHVYGYRIGIHSFEEDDATLQPKLIGLGQASTFTGFCQNHDAELFRPLETVPFEARPEQIVLLGYRAVCRELYAKKVAVRLATDMKRLDRGKPLDAQVFVQELAGDYRTGLDAGMNDVLMLKAQYDRLVFLGDHDQAKYYVVKFRHPPDVMCSAAWAPEFDFGGNCLQSLLPLKVPLDHVCFSLVATDAGGAAVFNWIGKNPSAEGLASSLDSIPDSQLSDALVHFCFEFFENIYWSPRWWDSLSASQREGLVERSNHNVHAANPSRIDWYEVPRLEGGDTVEFCASWEVIERIRQL